MGITTEVARLCSELHFSSLPDEVVDRTKYLILDYLGVALRGTISDSSQPVYQYLEALHLHASGVHVPATSLVVDVPSAALALGVSSHSLELDDVVNEASLHPAVSVISAALAYGSMNANSGQDMITAIVAGYELMVRLGMALDPAEHYRRGFHPTATCGVFGAAAAVSKLARLNAHQTAHALGIAGSQAAGSMEFLTDGAYTKRFHGGWSAHSGVVAASLAKEGFTGPHTIIEGKFGFLHSYSLSPSSEKVLKEWGTPYTVMQTSIKPHACCRYNQGSIDCIISIMNDNELTADDIESIQISILKAGFALVAEPEDLKKNPSSIVDAQFSMPFGAAVAVLHGKAFLDQYCHDTLASDAVKDLMTKVSCIHDAEIEKEFPQKWPARVELKTTDQRSFGVKLDHPKGDPENPLSWDEIIVKFRNLVAPMMNTSEQDKIIDTVRNLENVSDIVELMNLMDKIK